MASTAVEARSVVEDRVASLVRDAALLLSSERSLREVCEEARSLLFAHLDAAEVAIYLAREDALYPSDGGEPVEPSSRAAGVFESGVPARIDDPPAIYVPMIFGGKTIGVLGVHGAAQVAYRAVDVAVVEACALYLGAKVFEDERRALTAHLERLATVDQLTGVANRRAFDESLEREWSRALRSGEDVSVAMIDVDFFKAFNDTYGHVIGDAALQQVGRACADIAGRATDVFARYGGEEFAAILPTTRLEGAVAIAEAMRDAVSRLAVPHEGSSLGRVTISIGVASIVPSASMTPSDLVALADRALYQAKAKGRNTIGAEGYASTGPSARANRMERGNLPESRTQFVGRDAEVRAVSELVLDRQLVTIVGPGGAGKTRVAIEVARSLGSRFPDGTWFVDLATIAGADELPQAIAQAMHGAVPPAASAEQLARVLRERAALLVLDNCEHVIEPAAAFVELICSHGPALRVLCTSREALGLDGESVQRLGPLREGDSVALLVQRASDAGATLDARADVTLRAIALELDGIPLAIELAAPKLCVMTPAELLERLGDRFEVLRASNRRGPSRQQTLRALLDWSLRLLTPSEQQLFADLAVFAGGATMEAAREICGRDAPAGIEDLVAKSLVVSRTDAGVTRYDMLETTREYAAELLAQREDAPILAERHATYFERLARAQGEARKTQLTTPWLQAVTAQRRNFRAAISWLIERDAFDRAAAMLESLVDWFFDRGSVYGRDWIDMLRAPLKRDELSDRARAAFDLAVGTMLRRTDIRASYALVHEAHGIYAALGDRLLAAAAMRNVAFANFTRDGRIDRDLEPVILAAIEDAERGGRDTLVCELLNNLGILYTQMLEEDRLKDALDCFERAISIFERRGDFDRCGLINGNSSDIAFYMGDPHKAIARSRRAIALLELSEETWLAGLQYLNLGHFSTWAGDFTMARVALKKAFEGMQARYEPFGAASVFDKYAQLARHLGEHERAARLLAFGDRCFLRSGSTRQRREGQLIEEMRGELEARLGERYAIEYTAGSAFTTADAENEAMTL